MFTSRIFLSSSRAVLQSRAAAVAPRVASAAAVRSVGSVTVSFGSFFENLNFLDLSVFFGYTTRSDSSSDTALSLSIHTVVLWWTSDRGTRWLLWVWWSPCLDAE